MNTLLKIVSAKVIAYYLMIVAMAAFLCASPGLRAATPGNHGLAFPAAPKQPKKFETSTNIAPVIVVFVVVFAAGSKIFAVEKTKDSLASQL